LGCGFPTGKLVRLFSLGNGHLIKFVHDSWRTGESPMARQLIEWVHSGEVLLRDRGFCNWFLISLLQHKEVDVVMRLHQARKTGTGRVCWDRPERKAGWDIDQWREMPKQLQLRVVRFRVEVPGFRTDHIAVVTTLLDETKYPDHDIAQLYLRRWQVELNFRDLKMSMGMDILRTQTPTMIEK
jgi:IS4 transposase